MPVGLHLWNFNRKDANLCYRNAFQVTTRRVARVWNDSLNALWVNGLAQGGRRVWETVTLICKYTHYRVYAYHPLHTDESARCARIHERPSIEAYVWTRQSHPRATDVHLLHRTCHNGALTIKANLAKQGVKERRKGRRDSSRFSNPPETSNISVIPVLHTSILTGSEFFFVGTHLWLVHDFHEFREEAREF